MLAIALSACLLKAETPDTPTPTDSGDTGTPPLRDAADVEPILDASCAFSSCHGDAGQVGGLDLEDAYGNLVDVESDRVAGLTYVVPFDPETSYLLAKLQGTQDELGGAGNQMPLGGELDAASLAIIETWIEDGALP